MRMEILTLFDKRLLPSNTFNLFNFDYLLPPGQSAGLTLERANALYKTFYDKLDEMYHIDKLNYENLKRASPSLQIDGVWPPASPTLAMKNFEDTYKAVTMWYKEELPKWGPLFKDTAERFAKARQAAPANAEAERMKNIEPLLVSANKFFEKDYPDYFKKITNEYEQGLAKYMQVKNAREAKIQQEKDDEESRRLLVEADKTRLLAEKITEEARLAEQKKRPLDAALLSKKAEELNAQAAQKEALAKEKASKPSMTPLLLAAAAIGALVLASQE